MQEPRIHSTITDCLPESHPISNETIHCAKCNKMLHASNNECMTTWVETARSNLCLSCFAKDASDGMPDEFGFSDFAASDVSESLAELSDLKKIGDGIARDIALRVANDPEVKDTLVENHGGFDVVIGRRLDFLDLLRRGVTAYVDLAREMIKERQKT